MHLEEFAEGRTSPIHSLDPRIKLVSFLPLVMVVATASGLIVALAAVLVSASLLLFSRLNLKAVLSRLYPVNLFILFLWLILPFSVQGETVFSLGPLAASSEGISYALSITLKSNAILLSTIVLVGTIPIFQLTHSLKQLKVPEKLVSLFFFCYRYISTLHQDYSSLSNAMKVRAFKPTTRLHTYRSYAYLVGMLLVRSYDHSQQIYQAMLCRGFKGKFPMLDHFHHLRKRDYLFFLLMVFVIGLLVTIEAGKFWRVR